MPCSLKVGDGAGGGGDRYLGARLMRGEERRGAQKGKTNHQKKRGGGGGDTVYITRT